MPSYQSQLLPGLSRVLEHRTVWEYLRHQANTLRSTLSKQDCSTNLYVLRPVHESEFNEAFVIGSKDLSGCNPFLSLNRGDF